MKLVGLVSVRDLLGCFIVASLAMSYKQAQLQCRAAAAFAAPRRGAATPASFSKKLELVQRSGWWAEGKLPMADILPADNYRIALIKARLNAGEAAWEQTQSSTQIPLYSGEILGAGNYIIRVGLGTPAQDLYLVVDTGSDLAWTQCLPCNTCYMQNDPVFDPSASFSYEQVLCASPQCAQLGSASSGNCSSTGAINCDYRIRYLDGSSTMGDFALEALTVDDEIASIVYPFGCGHENQSPQGTFEGFDGIVGFSRSSLAFPAQTEALFNEIFSYCMPPIFSSSAGYIEFGTPSACGGSMSTSLVGLSESTFYMVELESIQVEGTNSTIQPPTSKEMVVDSGTVITRLDRPLYEQVRDAFRDAASSMTEAPQGAGMGVFDTCYSVSNSSPFPRITFTFMGGLAFTPIAQNSVVPIDNNGTVCLALLPLDSSSGISILGNYQQQGRLFTFDIPDSTLSISSDAC